MSEASEETEAGRSEKARRQDARRDEIERDGRARRPKAETKKANRKRDDRARRHDETRDETTRNTADGYDDKTTTGDGRTERMRKRMGKASTLLLLIFRPTPSRRLLSRPLASISSPAPRSGDERTRESISGNDLRAYTTERAAEQTGTGPLSHYRSTGPYSHRHATRARTRAR